jgi:hypothetical protein
VAKDIHWATASGTLVSGTLEMDLENADSTQIMLVIGGLTVRRQWFLDPVKARNQRLVAMQLFDKELRMIKQNVIDPQDSRRFELGVAAILFLLGFAPAISVETDAPDILVATPGGRLIVVECATRIADFHSKLGKLVDRRGALLETLSSSAHPNTVISALVCALPRAQIAVEEDDLRRHQILLVTRDDMDPVFARLSFPNDPDELVESALRRSGFKNTG